MTSTIKRPLIFGEFFDTGLQESASPFITPASRPWGINLNLKASLLAAFLLMCSYYLKYFTAAEEIAYLLLILVYFLAGIPALIESIEDLTSWDVNIDVLMTLAAFGSVLIGSPMEGGLLLVLFAISGAMEDAVTLKAKSAISHLHQLSPTKAYVLQPDGSFMEKSLRDIHVGTQILVKSSEVVPLDGTILHGNSSVNLVHLTGENLPVPKKPGDTVQAGARNLEGALTLQVTHTSADSTLAKIIQLVTEAQEARPRLQRWFDQLSKKYATSIICLALLFALILPFILGIPFLGREGSIYRALAFLIAASPCALIIAIPIAYLSAVSTCARKGILLKGGITLDALASCRVMAVDKTGTLTTGELECLGLEPLHPQYGENKQQALNIAVAMENNTIHPIAKAILKYGKANNSTTVVLEEFRTVPGFGIEGSIQKEKVHIGHLEYIQKKLSSEDVDILKKKVKSIEERGELMAVMLWGQACYIFRFQDTLRPKINELVQTLQNIQKMHIVMLTGDHANNAKAIAKEAGIQEYYSGLRPEDKMRIVNELSQKQNLAMVGDGINDAPALARATVGIAMGKTSSAAAMEAADVILLHDNIERLSWLISKAKQTQKIVRQNLIIATLAIALASIPALAGIVPLWLAVVLHEGGTVLVGLNALRLLRS